MEQKYYTPIARFLHWAMALIFIAVWIVGFLSAHTLEAGRGVAMGFHKNFATIIIFLFVIRVLWRYTHPAPDFPDTMSPFMKKAAHWGHILIYFLIIAMPISGCFYSWSYGKPAPVLYLFDIPALIGAQGEWAPIFAAIHITLSWLTGLIILGHIIVAFKHHFVDKDGVLRGMLGPKKS